MPRHLRPRLLSLRATLSVAMAIAAVSAQSCAALSAVVPLLTFCGANASPQQVLQLAEGPAIFVDAIRTIAGEVGGQSQAVGSGMQQGINVSQQALQALGPYHYDGAGSYSRVAATDRSFRLRFFYGDGVAGKTSGQPIDADLARLDSYVTVPNFTSGMDFSNVKGPLFPLLAATGLSSGNLAFNDGALRLDIGSILSTTLKGYGLSLALSSSRSSIGQLVSQVEAKKLTLSLADTSMTNAALGFGLTLTKFDLTAGLDGSASTGGEYGFAVTSGPIQYFGDVTTVGGAPTLSLRCDPTASSEFASVSFVDGTASVHFNAQNLPISLPGLAPYLPH